MHASIKAKLYDWGLCINQLWFGDLAYVPTWVGVLNLASVVDGSRKVAGRDFGERMTNDLLIAVLNMALRTRRPGSVIHHSAQGNQYTVLAFDKRFAQMDVKPIMVTMGGASDNAMAEPLCRLGVRTDQQAFMKNKGRGTLGDYHLDRGLVKPTASKQRHGTAFTHKI